MICRQQLVQLQATHGEFRALNAEVVAISMDGREDARAMADHAGAEFPVLPDPGGQVVRRYGVFDLLGDGVAAPATFIVGRDGGIEWRRVGTSSADRPAAAEVVERVRELRS